MGVVCSKGVVKINFPCGSNMLAINFLLKAQNKIYQLNVLKSPVRRIIKQAWLRSPWVICPRVLFKRCLSLANKGLVH